MAVRAGRVSVDGKLGGHSCRRAGRKKYSRHGTAHHHAAGREEDVG